MVALRTFGAADLPALVRLWNRCVAGSPNFIELTEADFIRRVVTAPGFEPARLLVATEKHALLGYVHYGPRLEMWEEGKPSFTREEGHIYALVAPRENTALARALLEEGVARLAEAGARRILLYPSWVCGTQAMYNGVAGAYEMPGLSDTRGELMAVAEEAGFAPVAEYGTPELSLSEEAAWGARREARDRLWEQAREWGLRAQESALRPTFFAHRRAVTLVRGREIIAMTAYGPWEEYRRQYGRRLFGITSVQVDRAWRGKGLGKLVMLVALEAAREAGAEGVHLHVYRSNEVAWNLYHRALGFQPTWRWVTLGRDLAG